MDRRWERHTERDLREAIASSLTWTEVLRKLGLRPAGGNFRTVQKYAAAWEIPTDHFDPHEANRRRGRRERQPLASVLVPGSSYNRGTLKRRLFEEGIKERRCELCGQGEEWRGRRMALILDHINGIADDNRLENLQIVCPNCAATLDTHCGRNVAREKTCPACGARFSPRDSRQRWCSPPCGGKSPNRRLPRPATRKVERPPYEQLRAEVEAMGWSAVGRKYGVSDNAIRKWVRAYEQERGDDGLAA